MLVIDASAFTDLILTESEQATRVRRALAMDAHWCTTEHFVAEVANALRGLWLRRDITDVELDRGIAALAELPLDIWPTKPLLPRIRELMRNATVYDAAYVALAEEIGSPLVTTDVKLARIPGIRCHFLGLAP
jgi:predicted nucleic acid-binding protein